MRADPQSPTGFLMCKRSLEVLGSTAGFFKKNHFGLILPQGVPLGKALPTPSLAGHLTKAAFN